MSTTNAAGRDTSKQLGERAEAAVIEAFDQLEPVADSEAEHYDAVPARAFGPTERCPFYRLAVLEAGIPVEIKTTIPRLSTGHRGRFYLREKQHDQLVEDGGAYLFAVTEPHQRDPIAFKIVSARTCNDLIPSWIDAGDRADYSQITWTNVFHPNEVMVA
jgi:hypothetical protein